MYRVTMPGFPSEFMEGRNKDEVRMRIKNTSFRDQAVIEKVPSELGVDEAGAFHLVPRKGKR